MPKLNVIVVGDAGTGKSAVVRLIAQMLREERFDVEMVDEDDMSGEKIQSRLKAIRGSKVRIYAERCIPTCKARKCRRHKDVKKVVKS